MSKAKGKKKQEAAQPQIQEPDPKEIERIAEEKRRLEEEKLKAEARKTEIIDLPTGLKLLLNYYCIEQAWKHPKPKEYLIQFITRLFNDLGLSSNFDTIETSLIAEFHLYNLIFAKQDMELDDKKATILMNLLWKLLQNDNPFYQSKMDLENYNEQQKSELQANKTTDKDSDMFIELIRCHSNEHPPLYIKYFEAKEVKQILEYVKIGYFTHFQLYKTILFNKQKNDEHKMVVVIDEPLPIKPLVDSLSMGKTPLVIKEDDDDEMIRELEEIKQRQEELDRQRREEEEQRLAAEENLKDSASAMLTINNQITQVKDLISADLEEKDAALNERLKALEPKKKK